jgi:fumarate reductase subunit C
MIDFLIRVVQPRYSPSLMLGRFFVRNQIPEYVGATQKRFAWAIGAIIAIPMFYYLVIHFEPNPIKVLVCLICMALLFFEDAFSICLGCKLFNLFSKEQARHCPGGICEIRRKDPIQRFTPVQTAILLLTVLLMMYGTYAYFTKLPDRTVFTKKMKELMMSDAEKKRLEEKRMEEAFENF